MFALLLSLFDLLPALSTLSHALWTASLPALYLIPATFTLLRALCNASNHPLFTLLPALCNCPATCNASSLNLFTLLLALCDRPTTCTASHPCHTRPALYLTRAIFPCHIHSPLCPLHSHPRPGWLPNHLHCIWSLPTTPALYQIHAIFNLLFALLTFTLDSSAVFVCSFSLHNPPP